MYPVIVRNRHPDIRLFTQVTKKWKYITVWDIKRRGGGSDYFLRYFNDTVLKGIFGGIIGESEMWHCMCDVRCSWIWDTVCLDSTGLTLASKFISGERAEGCDMLTYHFRQGCMSILCPVDGSGNEYYMKTLQEWSLGTSSQIGIHV